jgi:hypothetical protein
LSEALIMDPPEIWWVKTLFLFFPLAVGRVWDILVDAYATRT